MDAAASAWGRWSVCTTVSRRRRRGWILMMTMMMMIMTPLVMRNHGCCGWVYRPVPSRSSFVWVGRRPWTTTAATTRRNAIASRSGSSRRTALTRSGVDEPSSQRRTFSAFLPNGGGGGGSTIGRSNEMPTKNPAMSSSSSSDRWRSGGFEHSSTDFATHVVVEQDEPMALSALVDQVLEMVGTGRASSQPVHRREPAHDDELTGSFLIELGAVWHLPKDGPKSPHLGGKPVRVLQPHFVVRKGDYVRIHHHPRRFPDVHQFDWSGRHGTSLSVSNIDDDDSSAMHRRLPGVIVAENRTAGFLVINKPMRVPVHMTVDNCRENVQHCLKVAKIRQFKETRDESDDATDDVNDSIYVSTPQRLDQNTSGLLVVATTKAFANYFADLLRYKTLTHIEQEEPERGVAPGENDDRHEESTAVHKRYRWYERFLRFLVCLSPDLEGLGATFGVGQSTRGAAAALQRLAESGQLVRHYLEPSIRSPKRFHREIPHNATSSAGSWQECLLRLCKVGPVYPLMGNEPAQALAEALWPSNEWLSANGVGTSSTLSRRPETIQAVVELEVELLTGRTHQIRGQLSEAGYPIVGDAQYGGAVAIDPQCCDASGDDQLALQCCQLEFVDPDIVQMQDGTVNLKRSDRWNRFRLDDAWWTSHLQKYTKDSSMLSNELKTTDEAEDVGRSGSERRTESSTQEAKPHLLPVRISLSPGRNKYVLVRARHRTDASAEEEWFVKSAAPDECGGPYHGNVAQDLREWIEAAGYEACVTGGGRIYYRPDENCATVYGFSYAFGRGDHNRATELIRRTGIYATVDSSPDLY